MKKGLAAELGVSPAGKLATTWAQLKPRWILWVVGRVKPVADQ
jgi:hypothetical protein